MSKPDLAETLEWEFGIDLDEFSRALSEFCKMRKEYREKHYKNNKKEVLAK